MSRIIKTLRTEGYPHREHRSKKGRRQSKPAYGNIQRWKRNKSKLKEREDWNEIVL